MNTLTAEQINAASGRELDALVAEYVMGFRWMQRLPPFEPCLVALFPSGNPDEAAYYAGSDWRDATNDDPPLERFDDCLRQTPPYSSDGNAMLQVLERMRELGWNCDLSLHVHPQPSAIFHVQNWDETDEGIACWKGAGGLPVQVCKSALLAILEKNP